jgi:eukaryotic-like serine/threonine-protein kinase
MSKVFTITEGLENMGALRTGGQGSVYKGRRIGPIITAVKLLPTPIHTESKDDKNYLDFLNEVEKLKKVNEVPNPNVVKILNSGITESGSFPFIEMEFIEGPDLEELLKPPHEKVFTIKETIKLADHLACALCHCHSVGVKHGDIKSNNIKFNIHSGNYVLLDFGLSVMSDEQRRSSMRHAGAIEFMAPEQNEGKMLFQTDIYSYGVILYELLAGQVPFPLQDNGETARNTVMISHMEKPVPDVMALRKGNLPASWSKEQQEHEMQVPEWLLQVVSRCLEKHPEARYEDGMALQKAMEYGVSPDDKAIKVPVTGTVPTDEIILPQPKQQDGIHLSTTTFAILITALVLLLIYSGYSFLNKPATQTKVIVTTPVDSASKSDSAALQEQQRALNYIKKRRAADSAVKKSIREQLNRRKETEQDSLNEDTSQYNIN